MDIYNSKIPLIFAKSVAKEGSTIFGFTLGQCTWYSSNKDGVTDELRRHEDCHKVQWKRDGIVKFSIKYLWYNIRYGYDKNPYEIEARNKEKSC